MWCATAGVFGCFGMLEEHCLLERDWIFLMESLLKSIKTKESGAVFFR